MKTLRDKVQSQLPRKSTFIFDATRSDNIDVESNESIFQEDESTFGAPGSDLESAGLIVGRAGSPSQPLRDRSKPFCPEIGEMVHVKQFNREGEVLSAPAADGKIEVRIGAMKMRLEPIQLKSLRDRKDKSVHINVAAPLAASEEINLVGKTTDEALFLLEKHMDDAILAGLKNIWIIHGRGTGALRTAIRRWLKAHSQYSNFDYAPIAEGGDGATVVHLDEGK